MKHFLKFIKNKKTIIFFIFITTIYEIFATTVSPKMFSKIIDEGILKNNMDVIKSSGLLIFGISFLSIILNVLGAILITKIGFEFTDYLRRKLFDKVQDFSFEDIKKYKSTSVITRITKDTNSIAMFFTGIIRRILIFPFSLGFALYFAFKINAKLTTYAIIILPILMVVVFLIGKVLHKLFDKLNKKIDKMNQVIKENIIGIKDVKIYTLEDKEVEKFDNVNKDIKLLSDKSVTAIITIMPIMDLIIKFILAFIIWKGVLEIKGGVLETGELIALIMYFGQIIVALISISSVLGEFFKSLSSFRRVNEILEIQKEEKDRNKIKKITNLDISLKNADLEIEDKKILKDINLEIPFGSSLGIIGNTGSSKSSLINVISGIFKPTTGKMYVGGIDIKDIDEEEYIEKIAYVPQKLVMLSGNIRDNITMKNENISDEEVIKALKISESYEFVSKYDDKLDHEVEEGGSNFSGGQKQRLNIARGIAKRPQIIILDDSTSAIDQTTERKIWKNIENELGKITKIVISQRISSIKNMDKIVVMNKGKISSIGKHEDLINEDKIYKEIYEMQK